MKCKVNVVELSNELEEERGDIFFRSDFGGEKSFHARQKKLEEGITRVLLHRLFSFVVSDSNCATIARNSFCTLLWKRVGRLIVDGN